ncbi:SAM-dependent methyltransferase [soil metagenome]
MKPTFYFSHPDYEKDFLTECGRHSIVLEKIANGLFCSETKHNGSLIWPRDTWVEAEVFEFESISKAVARLRELSKLPWRHVSLASHRRGELIEQAFSSKTKILKMQAGKVAWPENNARSRSQPSFALIGPNKLVACLAPSDEAPGGAWNFDEDREGPPSRAYLKLWEWGWRTSVLPAVGETAFDLGASPGGWTWVLAQAGLNVRAFDRAPLDLKLPKKISDRIHFSKGDAFQVVPQNSPATDWVFCDVIAEPHRTVELIESWIPTKAGLVFTIKFKGETDFASTDRLQKIPGAHVRHLDVNKHEVTFWRTPVSI